MPGYSVSVYERHGSPFWWAKCYLEGSGGKSERWSTEVRIDAGTRRQSRRMGQKRAEEEAQRRADRAGSAQAAASDTALSAVARRMIKQKVAQGRRPRAVETLAWVIEKRVEPFFGKSRDIRSIRRPDLEAFKADLVAKGYKPVTVNGGLTGIRQILKHAANVEELIDTLPHVFNVEFEYEPAGRALTAEQVAELIDSVDALAPEAREYLLFLANTGLRRAEALAIKWVWVDFEAREIKIPAEFRKGGKRQLAATPINDVVLGLLQSRQGREKQPKLGRVWFQQKHDGARNSAAKKAGLGRVRNHDLRHTFGSLAHASGASLVEVRDLLGHRTLAMVNHYAHTYDDRLKAVANRVQLGPGVCPASVPSEGTVRARKGSKRTHQSATRIVPKYTK